jgi:hypothetical protein
MCTLMIFNFLSSTSTSNERYSLFYFFIALRCLHRMYLLQSQSTSTGTITVVLFLYSYLQYGRPNQTSVVIGQLPLVFGDGYAQQDFV